MGDIKSMGLLTRPFAAHHEEQISNFLRFSSYKRQLHIKELDAVFEEMADSRLVWLSH